MTVYVEFRQSCLLSLSDCYKVASQNVEPILHQICTGCFFSMGTVIELLESKKNEILLEEGSWFILWQKWLVGRRPQIKIVQKKIWEGSEQIELRYDNPTNIGTVRAAPSVATMSRRFCCNKIFPIFSASWTCPSFSPKKRGCSMWGVCKDNENTIS